MRKKSLWAGVLSAAVLACSLAGCSGSAAETAAQTGTAEETQAPAADETAGTAGTETTQAGDTAPEAAGDTGTIVSTAGKVLVEHAAVLTDENGEACLDLGNGLKVYAGEDGILGTADDRVRGIGSYYINDTTGTEKEPLEWRLLDIEDGEAVLITAYAVEPVPFNADTKAGNDWKNSNLRSWLNSRGGATEYGDTAGFYDTAFTDEEKKLIAKTTVRMNYEDWPLWDTTGHPENYFGATGTCAVYNKARSYEEDYDTTGMSEDEVKTMTILYAADLLTTTGDMTSDYVYALSCEEFFDYFGDPDLSNLEGRPDWVIASYRDALFPGTDYAQAKGLRVHDGSNPDQAAFAGITDTWLRSQGFVSSDGEYSGCSISSNGNINAGKLVNSAGYGTLPVIRVVLNGEADQGPETSQLLAGAAKRAITPTDENGLLPIPFVGSGASLLTSAANDINVRVIALQAGDEKALIICTESGKGPYGPQFVPLYAEHAGIPLDNVFVTTTHTHSVPENKEEIDMDLDMMDETVPVLHRWAKLCYLQTIDAIDEALANLEPAKMGINYVNSYINVNRNRPYYPENGETYVGQGFNGDGYSDKTFAVVEFADLDDNPIAFLTNYAMHAVVMYAPFLPESALHSDVPGYVSTQLETKYEGSVALWTSGFAGDQNPIVCEGNVMPNLETGDFGIQIINNPAGEIVEYLGGLQYADALRAISGITDWVSEVDIAAGYAGTTIPSSTRDSGEFPVALQLVRIGDLALIGHGGELYNSFTRDLLENTDIEHLLAFDNVWSREDQEISYHPDDDAIANGSYHDTTQYDPGYLSDAIIELTNSLLEDSYK